jgi:sec-independent protein translocase protein TatC
MICYIIVFIHAGVQVPFFPYYMLFYFHLSELKFRLLYLLFAFLFIFILIYYYIDLILLIFTPNIKTVIIYSNIIDSLWLKIKFACFLSIWFLTPFITFSLWSFFRPGFFVYQDFNLTFWFMVAFLPLIFYFTIIAFYNYYILLIGIGNNDDFSLIGRFIPTLFQIINLNTNIIIFTWFVLFTIIFIKFNRLYFFDFFIKFRIYIIFSLLLVISFFLPPDIFILFLASSWLILIYEILLFIKILKTIIS